MPPPFASTLPCPHCSQPVTPDWDELCPHDNTPDGPVCFLCCYSLSHENEEA